MRLPALAISLIAATAFTALPAQADETWDTPAGTMVYLEDTKDMAIWEVASPQDGLTRLYFPGLQGNFDNRSVHQGFWVRDTGNECRASLTGPDGHSGQSWGEVTLVFHDSGFPSNWTMLIGSCFEGPSEPLAGQSPLIE
ncbi:MAG: hypothetical protein KI785_07930 [Devosiaceae bacterium]|nr:hypothetical protein [Devosiaceae bacterium MH13]